MAPKRKLNNSELKNEQKTLRNLFIQITWTKSTKYCNSNTKDFTYSTSVGSFWTAKLFKLKTICACSQDRLTDSAPINTNQI